MGDFRRQRGASPRQTEQFVSKGTISSSVRRPQKDWDAGRRELAASRGTTFARRNRSGWETGSARIKSPAAADRRQDEAESDDDIAAKPRPAPMPAATIAGSAGVSRAPAHAQLASHAGSGAAYFNNGSAAPPPDLVRSAYDSEDVASVPPKKASALYTMRHHGQETLTGQLDANFSRMRPQVPETSSPAPVVQHRPTTAAMAQAAPSTAAQPAVANDADANKPVHGAGLELSSSVSRLSERVTAMQSAFQAHVKEIEALQSTTLSHKSLIAALQHRIDSMVDQTDSLGGQVMQLETSHGKRLAEVEAANAQVKVQLQTQSQPAATEIQTEARETVGDTHMQGPQPHVHIKAERNGEATRAATAADRTEEDSRVGANAAGNAPADMTPTSPALLALPSSGPGESKPSPTGLTALLNGAAAADQAARRRATGAGKHVDARTAAAMADDTMVPAGLVRFMRSFPDRVANLEHRCSRLAAAQDAAATAVAAAPATDAGVLEAARTVLRDAQEALREQRDMHEGFEMRTKVFTQDVERMMKQLEDQMMNVDRHVQNQTSKASQAIADCEGLKSSTQALDAARSALQDKQDDMERRMTELSATVAKVQQLQQNLTFQVQKADAERQKELRRAREAATKAAIVDQQRQERERQSAEARASDAAAVQLLQQENTQLKARVTALEKLLTQDGIQELVQKAVLASESKAAAAGIKPKAGGTGAGKDAGKPTGTPAVSGAASGSTDSPSGDGKDVEGSAEEPEEAPPKKAKRKAPTKRKRTTDTETTEGQDGNSAEKKARPGKKTRQGTRGSK